MTEKKDFTTQDYEDLIEELIKENEALKERIAELENRDQPYTVPKEPIKEIVKPIIEAETNEPVILVEDVIKQEEIKPIEQKKEIIVSDSIFSKDVAPLEMSKGQILQGDSRRECPKCWNHNKTLIRETIDKTHLISDYPRMYGKKYHCGECGVEWRVPLEI